jgi:hypothetical protein
MLDSEENGVIANGNCRTCVTIANENTPMRLFLNRPPLS